MESEDVLNLVDSISEFRPFVYFVVEVLEKYRGAELINVEFNMGWQIQKFLSSVKNTNDLTDSVFTQFFIGLPCHSIGILCLERNEVWQPSVESFRDFSSKSKELIVINVSKSRQEILDWMMLYVEWGNNQFSQNTTFFRH